MALREELALKEAVICSYIPSVWQLSSLP